MIPTFARLRPPSALAFALTFTTGALFAVLGSGCSSTVVDPGPAGPAACDSTKCAPGNECIAVGGETKCRKTCSSNSDPAKACPFGFACTALTAPEAECKGAACICTELAVKLEKKDKGQWGAACNPADGIAANKACDAAQQFQCYAQNPVDGAAYCTRACAKDAECGAGFFCDPVTKRCLTGCRLTTDCPMGATCSAGSCSCPGGEHACGQACVSSDAITSCGNRCSACPQPANGTATCSAGRGAQPSLSR